MDLTFHLVFRFNEQKTFRKTLLSFQPVALSIYQLLLAVGHKLFQCPNYGILGLGIIIYSVFIGHFLYKFMHLNIYLDKQTVAKCYINGCKSAECQGQIFLPSGYVWINLISICRQTDIWLCMVNYTSLRSYTSLGPLSSDRLTG